MQKWQNDCGYRTSCAIKRHKRFFLKLIVFFTNMDKIAAICQKNKDIGKKFHKKI